MAGNAEIRRKRISAFRQSLGQIRLWVSVMNALFYSAAMLWRGQTTDALVAVFYLLISVLFLAIPFLRRWAGKWLQIPLIGLDLAVAFYLIYHSGGADSELYPALFLPVLAAAVSCRFPGITLWCSLAAAILILTSLKTAPSQPLALLLKTAYLYLTGFLGGYLVQHTYTVTEEVSRKLARWNLDLERLNSFSLEVTASSNLEEVVEQTLKIVRRGDSASMVAMMVFDEKGLLRIYDSLGWEADWREKYRRNPLTRNSLALAPIRVFQKPLLCSNIRKHAELIKIFAGIPVESLFAFPLVIEHDVAGALVLTGAEPRQLPEEEVRILAKITNQAALAIQNMIKLKGKTEQAEQDGLTGLYNRGYFNEKLDELIFAAQQKEEPLSLIMLDVDNFKEYNDSHGHPAGDLMLQKVAAVIAATAAAAGIAARYGGEEFAVILPDTAVDAALAIAERIRARVAGMVDPSLKTRVTLSVGVATLPFHAKDRASLLEYCDKSLYQAKHNGKNRVCCGY